MRRVCLAALSVGVLFGLVPVIAFGQGSQALSIANYQYVSEQRISPTDSYITYRADLVNIGKAWGAVTASVMSMVPSVQVAPGQGNLYFSPVPANSSVHSRNTFTILVNRTVVFDFANLRWTFVAPVANAGPNQTVKVGNRVTLDGTGSSNPSDFGSLAYNWRFISTPFASTSLLNFTDIPKPSFLVDVPGDYVIMLTVSNGGGSDSALVTISTSNSAPVANAGANRTAALGSTVTLNGSGSSDVNGDPLTYSWTLLSSPSGSSAVLVGANTVSPIFIVDKPGSYVARLVVNDGQVNSAPSTVTITTQNTPPVANAGPNQIKTVGALVQLNGSGSTDVDGDALTYQWSLITRPAGSTATLNNVTLVNPTFTADRAGTYVAQLIVNDGKGNSTPATVQITTNAPLAPTASAGPDQTVGRRTTVQLNGSGTDPQSLPLTFLWSFTTKPPFSTATLSSATIPNPTFVADMPGNYVVQLIANNGFQNSPPDTVTITTTNTAPVANAGANKQVPTGVTVPLDGSGSSDADNDPLTYLWSFTSRPTGSTSTLSSTTSQTPSFFADVAGTYVVQLIVRDGVANSAPVTVTILAGGKTIALTPNPLNLATSSPGILTVTLGEAAGAGGLVVSLLSDNVGIASVPANVTVPEGQTGVNVSVTPGSAAGTATIFAGAPGFIPNTATVNVNVPTITVALEAATVGVGRTVNGTLTINAAAPAAGVLITLSSNPTGIVTLPGTALIQAGNTTVNFTVTGVAVGQTTIRATATGFAAGAAGINASLVGAIQLTSNVKVAPNQSTPFPVSLITPAPVGGVTITLASSNTSRVTISPLTVFIAQGATTPATQPEVTGVAVGSATITGSAPGFTGASESVQVVPTLAFQQQNVTIGTGVTQNLTLNLAGGAGPGGQTVNLSSSNPAVATVPSTVSFAPNATSTLVPVTSLTVGSTVIHASNLPNLADTTANVTVTNLGGIGLPSNVTIGLGQSAAFPVTLPSNAPAGGVTVTLASSDTGRLTISPTTLNIPQGAVTPAVQPQITGVNLGTADITASAAGFVPTTRAVQVTATISFAQTNVTIPSGTQNLTLNLSGPAPTGGLIVNLSSTNTAAATVPATVSFAAGATSVPVPVTAVGSGATVIHASKLPNLADTTANVAVQSGLTLGSNVTVVPGNTSPMPVTLPTPAPAGGVSVSLSSSDTTKLTILQGAFIPEGQTTPVDPAIVAGVNFGNATVTAQALGYPSASTQVKVTASLNFFPPTLSIVTGTGQQNLSLTLSTNAPSNLTFNLTSSNTGAATVPNSVVIPANSNHVNVPVTPAAPGTTIITASTNTPNIANITANVTVRAPGTINLPSNLSVPLGTTVPFPVTLAAPAPAAVTIALASSNTAKLTITPGSITIAAGQTAPATQPTVKALDIGTVNITASAPEHTTKTVPVNLTATVTFSPPSITIVGATEGLFSLILSGAAPIVVNPDGTIVPGLGITINTTSSNPAVARVDPSFTFYADGSNIQTLIIPITGVSPGTAVIHANALPYIPDVTGTVTVLGPGAISIAFNTALAPNQTAPFPISLTTPAPAGGVAVALASSDTSKGTIAPATVNIAAGQTTPATQPQVTGKTFGTADITASAPGYASATKAVQVTATMSFAAPTVTINGIVTQNVALNLSSNAPAGGLTVNLTSSNTGAATVPASVLFAANTNTVNVLLTAVAPGSTTITADALPGTIANANTNVTVQGGAAINLPASATVGLGNSAAYPVTLSSPAPAAVTVTLTSSNTSRVTISPATVNIAQGATAPATQPQITGVNLGNPNITALAPGYTSDTGAVLVNATVNFPQTNVTVPSTGTQNITLNLSAAAPAGGVIVNLSSSDTGVATVPATATFAAGSTSVAVPVTSVAAGSTVIHASKLPNIPDETVNVTVGAAAGIVLPAAPVRTLGQTAPFNVRLSTAAPAAVTISLVSSDTSKVTITPASVNIAAGQTAPATLPQVKGVNVGSANITASATGYASASTTVQVNATVNFPQTNVTVPTTGTQNITLNLSAAAPAAGVVVNLSSSNTGVATVPATVTFTAGSTSVAVPVTSVAVGSTVIHASKLPNIPDETVNVTVAVPGTINLPSNATVALGASKAFPVTLASPAPAAVTIALASSNTSRVTISPASINIAAGQTAPATQPTITGVNLGSANITATATGYAAVTAPVQVGATLSFAQPNVTIAGFRTQALTLNLSAAAPAGLTISLTSSNTGVATTPASVPFPAGATSMTVPVTSLAFGSSTITADASAPNVPNATTNVTVQTAGPIGLPPAKVVGLGNSSPFGITLPIPAPTALTVTLTNANPGRVSISPATVAIAQGATTPAAQPQVTGLNIGSANITASAPGYTSSTVPVQVTAIVDFTQTNLTISGFFTRNLTLTLSAAAPAGGLTVNLSSGNPGVATVPATATFPQGATSVNVPVNGESFGTTMIHASALPSIADTTASVTVQSAGVIGVPANVIRALGQSAALAVTLPAQALEPVTVNLVSSNPTRVTVSPSTVTIPQGATTPATQPQVTGVNVGSASITASSPGYTPGVSAVVVNATISFNQPNVTITGLKTQNLTLTLSDNAPAAGLTVNLSSSNTAVATVPATATFAANATTTSVPVTSKSLGSTVIHASKLPNIADVTSNVTVVTAGPIGMPSNASVGLGRTATFPIMLPQAAPAGGVTVTLASSNVTRVTITPATVTIAAGQTAPATQPTVHGVNVGSANITASAPAHTSSSQPVQVGATVTWPQNVVLSSLGANTVQLTLSAAAPLGGVSVSLSSSNGLVANVPLSVTFPQGSTSVNVTVTALSAGSTVLHATGVNIPDATTTITVALATLGTLTVSNASIGQNLQTTVTISISTPAPAGGLSVTLQSSDPAKVLIGSSVLAGSGSVTVQFVAGLTSLSTSAKAFANSGTVSLTASAPGYASGTGTMTLTPSAFVISGPNGIGVPSFPTNVGLNTPLTVSAARLTPALNYAETQEIRGGLAVSVQINNSATSVGTVTPPLLNFVSVDTSFSLNFAALGVGSTTITAVQPPGFTAPPSGLNSITANVGSVSMTAPNATVGKGLQVGKRISLNGVPSTDRTLTITSTDATRLRFSKTASGAGLASIDIIMPAGFDNSPEFFVHALASSGIQNYTASMSGFGTSTGTVTFAPSGIVIAGPTGLGFGFSTTSGAAPSTITVYAAMLDGAGNYVDSQAIAGTAVNVVVSSSSTSVGSIGTSPVTIAPGSLGVTTTFVPMGAGATVLAPNVPAGFSAPNQYASIMATVGAPGIGITTDVSVGRNLQEVGSFTLGEFAPPGGVTVTLSTSNPNLKLSKTQTAAGSSSISFLVPAGGFTGTYYIQALNSSGNATYTVSAPGFTNKTGTVTMTPSGIALGDAAGVPPGGLIIGSSPVSIVVFMAQLNPGANTFVQTQQLAGGITPVSVSLATTAGTIVSPAIITPGAVSKTVALTAPAGSAVVNATTPTTYQTSNKQSVGVFVF